jgi:hypothetical protein
MTEKYYPRQVTPQQPQLFRQVVKPVSINIGKNPSAVITVTEQRNEIWKWNVKGGIFARGT